MSVYANVNGMKKISNIFANVGGVKKEIVSAWVNKDGVPTKIFGLNAGGPMYIIVGTNGSNKGQAYYSFDGEKWSAIAALCDQGSSYFNGIAYGNGKYVVSHYGSSDKLLVSVDGINWAEIDKPGVSYMGVSGLKFLNGKFMLAVFKNIFYSLDGENWTQAALTASQTIQAITYGNGKYVAVGLSGTSYYSTDGINWTAGSGLNTSYNYRKVEYGNGVFVAITDKAYPYYSTDGITWVKGGYTPTNACDLTFGNGIFMVAIKSSSYIYISTDGKSWTRKDTSMFSNSSIMVKFANDKFYWFSHQNSNHYGGHSSDGELWAQFTPPSYEMLDMTYGGMDG